MDDHRPVQVADPDNQLRSPSSAFGIAAVTGELLIEPSPPFRSSPIVLDDGRAVGLTEPSGAADRTHRAAGAARQPCGRWTVSVPLILRTSWGGVGVWLGAFTVAGLAAMLFGPSLADLAGDSRSFGSDRGVEESLGIGVDGGAGAHSDEHRASRARTTGELTEESGPSGPVTNGSGRSSGPSNGSSGGPDLDLGHRIGEDPSGSPASAPGVTPRGAGGPEISSRDGEPPTTASDVTADERADEGDTVAEDPGSLPPGSTSLPEPAAPPPQVMLPPSETPPPPQVMLPPSETPPPPQVTPPKSPPSTNGPPASTPTRPPVTATPPTTRNPVPADTRPSPGGGLNRNRGRSGDSSSGGSNGSNGRAVGRQR